MGGAFWFQKKKRTIFFLREGAAEGKQEKKERCVFLIWVCVCRSVVIQCLSHCCICYFFLFSLRMHDAYKHTHTHTHKTKPRSSDYFFPFYMKLIACDDQFRGRTTCSPFQTREASVASDYSSAGWAQICVSPRKEGFFFPAFFFCFSLRKKKKNLLLSRLITKILGRKKKMFPPTNVCVCGRYFYFFLTGPTEAHVRWWLHQLGGGTPHSWAHGFFFFYFVNLLFQNQQFFFISFFILITPCSLSRAHFFSDKICCVFSLLLFSRGLSFFHFFFFFSPCFGGIFHNRHFHPATTLLHSVRTFVHCLETLLRLHDWVDHLDSVPFLYIYGI